MSNINDETSEWSRSFAGLNYSAPIMDLDSRLRRIERQILILSPTHETALKYPALLEAYEQYKIIEKLTVGTDET